MFKDKDLSSKDKDKDCIVKDKDQDKDCILVLKEYLRTRTRTNITECHTRTLLQCTEVYRYLKDLRSIMGETRLNGLGRRPTLTVILICLCYDDVIDFPTIYVLHMSSRRTFITKQKKVCTRSNLK